MARLPRKKTAPLPELQPIESPVFGTVEHSDTGLTSAQIRELVGEHSACNGWCPGCEDALDCDQAWARWDPAELCQELQRAELEYSIDESLGEISDDDIGPLGHESNTVTVRCEILSPSEGVPPQLRDFLRELERLVKRTEQQLKPVPKKKIT